MPLFEWLARHPADASMFSETMVGFHGAEPAAVAAACDFSKFETVVDVGGATGNLLATILGRHLERVAYSSTCRMSLAMRRH